MPPGQPKYRRRPDDRPGEIVAAALEVFAERGFAAARLDDIAKRAGVSKGALYLYFETKEALFREVVSRTVTPEIGRTAEMVAALDLPFEQLLRGALARVTGLVFSDPRIPAVAKVVIGESRNFPELARIWLDGVVQPGVELLSGLVARAQARGEIRAGDPRLFAFGIMGPVLLNLIWRETFEPVGGTPIDTERLVAQHLDTVIVGMRPQAERGA